MIGQQKLISEIDYLITEDKFPRFSILVGKRGSQYEEIARYIVDQFQGADYIQLPDVKVDTVRNMIKQAYSLHHLTFYFIPHADDMSVNAKNALLKVVEEVPNKAHFIMGLEDLSNTLATIESRAITFTIYPLGSSEIIEYARSLGVADSELDIYTDICNTPGDVDMLKHYGAKNFHAYAEYVVDNMTQMSGAEVFKLSDKLALKDEEDKYDLQLFLKSIQTILLDRCRLATIADTPQKHTEIRWSIVYCIGKYLADLRIKGINKSMLMDNMILEVRKLWKSQT